MFGRKLVCLIDELVIYIHWFGLQAAKCLEIKGFVNLTADHIANAMKKMSIEEIRELFDISNDDIPEEMEEEQKEMDWAIDQLNNGIAELIG